MQLRLFPLKMHYAEGPKSSWIKRPLDGSGCLPARVRLQLQSLLKKYLQRQLPVTWFAPHPVHPKGGKSHALRNICFFFFQLIKPAQ